ncbi:hypothetical protein RCL1_006429 [Eukaryota sp. TZLM3-RCL]
MPRSGGGRSGGSRGSRSSSRMRSRTGTSGNEIQDPRICWAFCLGFVLFIAGIFIAGEGENWIRAQRTQVVIPQSSIVLNLPVYRKSIVLDLPEGRGSFLSCPTRPPLLPEFVNYTWVSHHRFLNEYQWYEMNLNEGSFVKINLEAERPTRLYILPNFKQFDNIRNYKDFDYLYTCVFNEDCPEDVVFEALKDFSDLLVYFQGVGWSGFESQVSFDFSLQVHDVSACNPVCESSNRCSIKLPKGEFLVAQGSDSDTYDFGLYADRIPLIRPGNIVFIGLFTCLFAFVGLFVSILYFGRNPPKVVPKETPLFPTSV